MLLNTDRCMNLFIDEFIYEYITVPAAE